MSSETDSRYIPTISLGNDRISLQDLNEKIRQIYSNIMALEGRLGTINLQGSVALTGNLVASGDLTTLGNVVGVPIVGVWTDATGTGGTGSIIWTPTLVANKSYFSLNTAGTQVAFLVDGIYAINAQVAVSATVGGALTVDIVYDGLTVSRVLLTGLGASAVHSINLSAIVDAGANKGVSVSLVTGTDRLGDGNKRSLLTIRRLN